MTERQTCGDCGVKEGQLHVLGCDMEPCPACGGQLISCDCDEYMALVEVKRAGKLKSKKRIPFIVYPNLCARCGALWPDTFNVPDAEWEHYIEPRMRGEMLCKACYTQIKAWIDGEGLGLKPTTQRPAARKS
jgi:hypothetical protein